MSSLYRGLLRAGASFPVREPTPGACEPLRLRVTPARPPQDYNVRDYILRRTKQDFRRNRALSGPALAAALQHVRGVWGAVLHVLCAPFLLLPSGAPRHVERTARPTCRVLRFSAVL